MKLLLRRVVQTKWGLTFLLFFGIDVAPSTLINPVSLLSSSTPSVNAVPFTANQTRIVQCTHCGVPFVSTEALEKHTSENHVEENDTNKSISVDDIKVGSIVMKKQRVFNWPAKILTFDSEAKTYKVRVYNPNRSTKVVQLDNISKFECLKEFMESMPKGWKTGYLEALEEFNTYS